MQRPLQGVATAADGTCGSLFHTFDFSSSRKIKPYENNGVGSGFFGQPVTAFPRPLAFFSGTEPGPVHPAAHGEPRTKTNPKRVGILSLGKKPFAPDRQNRAQICLPDDTTIGIPRTGPLEPAAKPLGPRLSSGDVRPNHFRRWVSAKWESRFQFHRRLTKFDWSRMGTISGR